MRGGGAVSCDVKPQNVAVVLPKTVSAEKQHRLGKTYRFSNFPRRAAENQRAIGAEFGNPVAAIVFRAGARASTFATRRAAQRWAI